MSYIELYRVTQKILEYRNTSQDHKKEIKKSVSIKYDHRQRSDSDARDFASGMVMWPILS